MSVLTMPPPPPGIPNFPVQTISVAKYHEMIQKGVLTEDDKVELIEGYIVPKMPDNPHHGGTIQNVEKKILRKLPSGWDTRVQSSITLRESEPEPDIALVKGDERTYLLNHPHAADIGLIVEVSDSSLSFDRKNKGGTYARANIAIYWIVNLVDGIVEVYTQPSGPATMPAYAYRQDFARGDAIPLILDGVTITSLPVSDLLP